MHHLKKTKPDSSTPLPTPPLTPTSSTSSEISPFDQDEQHKWVHGSITSLSSHSVTFTRPTRSAPPKASSEASGSSSSASAYDATLGVFEGPSETIDFDYAVYALGAGLPDPVNVWKPAYGGATPEDAHLGVGTKRSGVRFMERKAEGIKEAQRILIVGGGALGIRKSNTVLIVSLAWSIVLIGRICYRHQIGLPEQASHPAPLSPPINANLPYRDAHYK